LVRPNSRTTVAPVTVEIRRLGAYGCSGAVVAAVGVGVGVGTAVGVGEG